MPQRLRAVALNLDPDSLLSLREALPGWKIEAAHGATAAPARAGSSPGADLLVVKAREEAAQTSGPYPWLAAGGVLARAPRAEAADAPGLCASRPIRAGRADVPLLVLVPSGPEPLAGDASAAGPAGYLILPVRAEEVANILDRVRQGSPPAWHRPGLDQTRSEERWQDEGGQG